jgi:hypothetical protein
MDTLLHEPGYIRTQPFEIEIRARSRPEGRDDGRIDTLKHTRTHLSAASTNVHIILIVFDIFENPAFLFGGRFRIPWVKFKMGEGVMRAGGEQHGEREKN